MMVIKLFLTSLSESFICADFGRIVRVVEWITYRKVEFLALALLSGIFWMEQVRKIAHIVVVPLLVVHFRANIRYMNKWSERPAVKS